MKKILLGLASALVMAVAVAAPFYVGYNPNTNLTGVTGVPVATGIMPVLSGAGCGTLATVQASEVGGAGIVQFTANNATSCTLTVTTATIAPATSAAAVPNGLFCVAVDETTRAATFQQTAHTTTSCTVSATAGVVSGDLILVEINGF